MSQGWKIASASVIGTSHLESSLPCQDAFSFCYFVRSEALHEHEGQEVLIAAVSDGAGSATYAEEGSQECVQEAVSLLSTYLNDGGELAKVNRIQAEAWVQKISARIAVRAEAINSAIREFACTLLVAAFDPSAALFLQIGDGGIVIGEPEGQFSPVFWPQSGEYANQTYFVTEAEATDNLQFDVRTGHIDKVALFSDGIQSLALHYESKTAHAPFWAPLFNTLHASGSVEYAALERSLAVFLDSKPVNARTNDDKTLLLAVRPALLIEVLSQEQKSNSQEDLQKVLAHAEDGEQQSNDILPIEL